jgi:RHS repeat-associated protein
MATAIMNITETALANNVSVYRYDQLNRIKNVETNLGTNFNAMTNTGAYHAEYTFDGNGNLQTLKRNDDDGVLMDNFTYHYQSALTNNKLDRVTDGVTTTGALDYGDIQHGQGTNNYTYDAKGQLIADAQENISEIKWYQSGKVKSIKKSSATGSEVRFFYDPMGNRILKIEQPRLAGVSSNQEKWITTYYALDASGNTMATYTGSYAPLVGGDPNEFTETFTLNDHTIFGARRLGVVQHNEVLNTRNIEVVSYTGKAFNVVTELSNTPATIDELTFNVRELGKKSYELANHLGNVLAVITDQKIAVDDHQYVSGAGNYNLYTDIETDIDYYHEVAHGTGTHTINSVSGDGIVDYYLPNVIMFSDYYPYGMQLINRYGEDNTRKKYRYGFQGQEVDDEVKGEGKSVNYKYRMHDPRLGRFFAVDPLAPEYPHYTPYQFSGNRLIDHIELEGLEEFPSQSYNDMPSSINHFGETGEEVNAYMEKNYRDFIMTSYEVAKNAAIRSKKLESNPFNVYIRPVLKEIAPYIPVIGDMVDVLEAKQAYIKGDYSSAMLSMLFLIPGADFGKPAKPFFKKLVITSYSSLKPTKYLDDFSSFMTKNNPIKKSLVQSEHVSGSYLLKFEGGMFYAGKGLPPRMNASIKRIETEYNTKLISHEFFPAKSTTEAFINEHKLMMSFGGPKSYNKLSPTYNLIFSPGKKKIEF